MSILTVIWALGAGACLALGIVHAIIWLRQHNGQRSWAHFLIALAALGAAANALFEINLLHTTSLETARSCIRHMHLSIAVVMVSLVWYLAVHLKTTRRWLAWTITELWGISLIINYLSSHSLTYREITSLKQVALASGETFTAIQGIGNPWKIIADMASLLFVVYIADAGIRLFLQGDRRRALLVAGSAGLFILIAGIHTPLVDAGTIESPILISLAFLVVVGALGLDLSSDVVKIDTLTRTVEKKDERWDTLLENVELAVISVDGQGLMTYVNPFYEKLSGFTKDQVLGRSIKDLLAPAEVSQMEKRFALMETEGPRPHSEWTLRCANEEEKRLAWSSVPLHNDDGSFGGILSVGEDITDRLYAEQALRDEKDRMNIILSSLETGMVLIDKELTVTWMNEKLRGLIPPGNPIGKKCFALTEDRNEPYEDCGAQKAFADGQVHETQRYSEPQKRWLHIISQPIKDEAGKVTSVLESVTDVTEKVESHQKLENALTEATQLHDRLEAENTYLQQEIQAANNFEAMMGESRGIKYVWNRISQVAEMGTTVLIEGETGTGKELAARAIHARSNRANHPLIKVNCASLPASLIESELFGHEKGAFTGATKDRKGHFELAHEGTIFLDEIGELPLETQAKLLSVLEDDLFIRVGSEKPRPLDVRVITATNRNLEEEVKAGRFRRDLYYRLNVYSLTIPPLRERQEDIPLLAQHFMEHFAKQQGKPITQISNQTADYLTAYSWPGNVRELRNIIQQAVIASAGPDLTLPEALIPVEQEDEKAEDVELVENEAFEENDEATTPPTILEKFQSLNNVQRDHIIHVLRSKDGQLEGKGGAAEILELKPSTLRNRMRKLGIGRKDIKK